MSDETDGAKPAEQDPLILQYDFFKFLTTMAILILGGVLSLAGSGSIRSPREMTIIILLLATAGVMAISGADNVVRSRARGRPLSRWTKLLQGLSMGALGTGTGAFLSAWMKGLT